MVNTRSASFNFKIFHVLTFLIPMAVVAQELKVFKMEDFDLNGHVKSCLVITDYGKEEYEFNEEGFLIKAITRYNDEDYDRTDYKFNGEELLEKRLENYREGKLVRNTSIANFYELDSTNGRKITENIISYNKEILDRYEYQYNGEGKLISIKRINDSGIDITKITYEVENGETTETYYLNDVVFKSVTTSKNAENSVTKIVFKEFMKGEPYKALEQKYSNLGKLTSEIKFLFDRSENSFLQNESKSLEYNTHGDVISERIKRGKSEIVKAYHYQYDDGEKGNWIRQIITPDNTYTSRRITYYSMEKPQED